MEESGLEFVWPSLVDAIPIVVIVIALPLWLVYMVFKYTHLFTDQKFVLIPVCIVLPAVVTLMWPLILKYSNLIGVTGGSQPSYLWYATELFGEFSEYVWASLTCIATAIVHRVVKARDSRSEQ